MPFRVVWMVRMNLGVPSGSEGFLGGAGVEAAPPSGKTT
jgi:hypothetical protein